tara:strand:+ start:862 stop:1728 length:867 start_codon:yes stop_codon:yes gene_type:complete
MCFIVDSNNIFIHNPKCAGTSVNTVIHKRDPKEPELQQQNKKLAVGHFGVYPLIINKIYNEDMKAHIICRSPAEWYVSMFFYVRKYKGHPYQFFAREGFEKFFHSLIDMTTTNNQINLEHLHYYINTKHIRQFSGRPPLWDKYKNYDDILDDINNNRYLQNHPDLNILLGHKNITEGLYTYYVLQLLSKVNPLVLFSKNKENIIDNLEDYVVDNVQIYRMSDISILLENLGFGGVQLPHAKRSKNRSRPYLDYYSDDMLEKLNTNHKIIDKLPFLHDYDGVSNEHGFR